MSNNADFYRSQSRFSDPFDRLSDFSCLPQAINELREIISNTFLHYADLSFHNVTIHHNRYAEMDTRFVNQMLSGILSLDDRPLTIPRLPKKRWMGVCRDSALLMASILRSRDIPARLRCGFVRYIIPNFFLDGFCLEYFDKSVAQWRLVDTRTSQAFIDHYQLPIHFDLCNLSDDHFMPAAIAWQYYRNNKIPSNRFGSRTHKGANIIRNRMIQDLVCLLKIEPLVWDVWGCMLEKNISNHAELDALSEFLILEADHSDKLFDFYQSHRGFQIQDKLIIDNPFLPERELSLGALHAFN